MAKVFEMQRRARRPIECDSCGDRFKSESGGSFGG